MAVLKLNKHDEAKEIEFELKYLTSLTTQQRFELMLDVGWAVPTIYKKVCRAHPT